MNTLRWKARCQALLYLDWISMAIYRVLWTWKVVSSVAHVKVKLSDRVCSIETPSTHFHNICFQCAYHCMAKMDKHVYKYVWPYRCSTGVTNAHTTYTICCILNTYSGPLLKEKVPITVSAPYKQIQKSKLYWSTCVSIVCDGLDDLRRGEVDKFKIEQFIICHSIVGVYINRRLLLSSALRTHNLAPILRGVICEVRNIPMI